jgi:DNA polymerase-3 subunit epsilon
MKDIIFFDLETTGALKNPALTRIIEISGIKVDAKTLEIIDKIYFKCNNDGVPIEPDAFERHGIKESDLVDCPVFTEVAPVVFKFFEGCDIGGHYCTFYDAPILYESFLRAGLVWNFREVKVYDTYTIYKKYNSGKLGELYKKYTGKDLDNAHSADADAMATLEIYRHQIENNEILDENELSTYSNRVDIGGNFVIEGDGDDRCVRMSFGKYKGKPVRNVDPSYLDWVGDNAEGFPSDTRFYAKQFAAKIRSGKK